MTRTARTATARTAIRMGAWIMAALAAAGSARAQDAARIQQAQKLFSVMHMDSLYGQLTRQVMDSVQNSEDQLFPANTLTPALRQEQTSFQARAMALVNDNISWQKLEPDFEKVYADAYTSEQLDGLIAFYTSPLGQAVLAKTPQLMQQGSVIARQHLAVVMPQLRQMVQDEVEKVQKITGTRPSPSGAH